MTSMNTPVKLADLLDALEWSSVDGSFENEAYVDRQSGKIYWSSSMGDADEELPGDIEDGTRYLAVPHKNDLDLGRRLVFRFVEEQLPESYGLVDGYFHKKGAYSRLRSLLEQKGCLEAWYRYEEKTVEQALRDWCGENGLRLDT